MPPFCTLIEDMDYQKHHSCEANSHFDTNNLCQIVYFSQFLCVYDAEEKPKLPEILTIWWHEFYISLKSSYHSPLKVYQSGK